MIDVLRDSFATQEQIAEAAQNALTSLYTIEILLVLVVVLLILLLITQRSNLLSSQNILRHLAEFNEDFKERMPTYGHGVTLHTSTHTWKPRKRRKSGKRRKTK